MTRKRGRKSAAELATGPVDVLEVRRPPPPDYLSAAQAEIWMKVTGCFPPDYFRKAEQDLLAMYCRHVTESMRISVLIDTLPEKVIKEGIEGVNLYAKLLRMRDTETRAATALARSMRITHQSRVHSETAGRMVESTSDDPKPWEDFGGPIP